MAKCPKCKEEVSFLQVMFTFSNIYTCNNCNFNFQIQEQSENLARVLIGIALMIVLGAIVMIGFIIPYGRAPSLVTISIVITSMLVSYIWWRYLAKLREPYE